MPTPDTKNSVVITKRFTYRSAPREWSNRYHFEGTVPADGDAWETLVGHICDAEKLIYTPDVEIVRAEGYDVAGASSSSPHGDQVYTSLLAIPGTADYGTDDIKSPGDAAILIRWSTPARSANNHPVYLMNYLHGVRLGATGGDAIAGGQVTKCETYAGAWITGFTDGTGARARCGPRGAVATGFYVHPEVRHRDFPL